MQHSDIFDHKMGHLDLKLYYTPLLSVVMCACYPASSWDWYCWACETVQPQ